MTRPAIAALALAIGLAAASPVPVSAADVGVTRDVSTVLVQADASAGGAQAAQPAAGLPQREPPPRTLAAFWPVYVGFVIALFGIVAYFVRGVGGRSERVARTIDELGTP
jgi:hypothetical protein